MGSNPLDPFDFPADLDGDFVPDIIDFDRDGDGVSNNLIMPLICLIPIKSL